MSIFSPTELPIYVPPVVNYTVVEPPVEDALDFKHGSIAPIPIPSAGTCDVKQSVAPHVAEAKLVSEFQKLPDIPPPTPIADLELRNRLLALTTVEKKEKENKNSDAAATTAKHAAVVIPSDGKESKVPKFLQSAVDEIRVVVDQATALVGALSIKDHEPVDPPLKSMPQRFKVQFRPTFLQRLLGLCCGCCVERRATTREYTLLGEAAAEDELDVRATDALSHTLMRKRPGYVRYQIRVYDQFDNPLHVVDRDPVSWKKLHSSFDLVLKVPMVLIDDVEQRYQAASLDDGAIASTLDQLRRVVNVDYRGDSEWRANVMMFVRDHLTFVRQRREAMGLQNFSCATA